MLMFFSTIIKRKEIAYVVIKAIYTKDSKVFRNVILIQLKIYIV